jgi:hypothetical protein
LLNQHSANGIYKTIDKTQRGLCQGFSAPFAKEVAALRVLFPRKNLLKKR